MTECRATILSILGRRAATPRWLAAWLGRPPAEIKAELASLQTQGLVEPLSTRRGKERLWILTETPQASGSGVPLTTSAPDPDPDQEG